MPLNIESISHPVKAWTKGKTEAVGGGMFSKVHGLVSFVNPKCSNSRHVIKHMMATSESTVIIVT